MKIQAIDAVVGVKRRYAKFKTTVGYLEHAIGLARQTGNVLLEGNLLNDLGFDYRHYVNTLDKAEEVLKQSIAIRKRIGVVHSASFSNLGWISFQKGKWDNAQKYYQKALTQVGERAASLFNYRLATIFMTKGDFDQAEQNFLYREQIALKYNIPRYIYEFADIALNYLLLGQLDKFQEYIEHSKNHLAIEVRPSIKWQYFYHIAEVYRIWGEREKAKQNCQESLQSFLSNAEDPGNLIFVAEARLVMGKILVDMGEYQEAITYLDKAKAAFEICGHYALGETLLYLGKAHLGLGGVIFQRQAHAYLKQALAEFQRLELRHKEQEAKEVLKAL